MLLIHEIVLDSFGTEHQEFKELLEFMLKIDPNHRPSAKECLNHGFFKKDEIKGVETAKEDFNAIQLIRNSKSTEKSQNCPQSKSPDQGIPCGAMLDSQ